MRQIASLWLPYQADRQLFSGLPSGWSTLEIFWGGQIDGLTVRHELQVVGLAQGLPEAGEVGPTHSAVGEEGVVVDLSVDDHVEAATLFGAVLPATDAGVGTDIAIFLAYSGQEMFNSLPLPSSTKCSLTPIPQPEVHS